MNIDIQQIIQNTIDLHQRWANLMGISDEAYPSKLSDAVQYEADMLNNIKFNLWSIVENYFGFSHHDFLGDGYVMFVDKCLEGDLTPNEVIEEILNLNLICQRKWIINTYLDYFIESWNNINTTEDEIVKEHNQVWFDVTLKKIEDKTGYDEDKMDNVRFNVILFVSGKVSKDDMIELFTDYILNGNVNRQLLIEGDDESNLLH